MYIIPELMFHRIILTTSQADITTKVVEALSHNDYLSTLGLSKALGCSRGCVVEAFNEIEADGMTLMRVRGIGRGAGFIGCRRRQAV